MPGFGYVRKSVMADDDKTLSPLVQEERIRALAASRGDTDLVILSDLGISGAKVEERPDYMRLVAAIESGEASAVYAYDLSRLHRNTAEALRFFKLAEDRNVPVRLVAESIDTSGPTGELMLTILAAMNAWTSRVTSVKIKASLARKRANGETLGGRPYGTRDGEDATAVVDAYRAERSLFRAARRLNEAGIPTRNGKSRGWSPSAVRAIVQRLEPDLLIETRAEDRPVRGGRAMKRASRFGRILRCSVCGSLLTPSYDPRADATRYYCHAYANVQHGRKAVMESAIIRAILPAMEETAIRMKHVTKGTDEVIDVDALMAKRERFIEMYGEGLITKARRDEVLREVEDGLSRAASARRVRRYTLPPDPDGEPEKVNAWMRDTFERVVVDMSTPGKRGVTTDVAITPEWRNGLRQVDAA